jgi:hypothetical protein
MFVLLPLLGTLAIAGTPSSSGYLEDGDGRHKSSQAFDGLLRSGWGISTLEEQPWIQLDLGRSTDIRTISIWPGNLKTGARSYTEYSRPRLIRVEVDGSQIGNVIEFRDEVQRLDIPAGVRGRKIKITIDEAYEGIVFRDLFIAEVGVNFTQESSSSKAMKWASSSSAQGKAKSFDADLAEYYEAHKTAEFGDDEAFALICEAAAEGAPFMRRYVGSSVGAGFRIQSLPSYPLAQDAIMKLKDPNGISALQLAALRSQGAEQDRVQEHVEILSAHMDLIGGGNPNIPYWGDTGFALGGIQSFGEPIAIEIDMDNQVLIADSGNNRIQLFSDLGRPERQWGPDADITNQWFTDGRSWYASGASAGSKTGQWSNPTDVVIVPGKDGDGFAGLDAKGHIQIFNPEGKLIISWRVETRNAAEAGVGGESYLSWLPKQQLLFAFIQDEAVGYTLASEEVHRWEIEDGIPNAVEVTKKGEILMAFGREVIKYDIGGFRHGVVIDDELLGQGFEDMDLTLDEDQKLWIFTDAGWAFKFKKPGKLDWKIQAYDKPTRHPRIAVREGILFLSHFDRIEQIDMLQLELDQEAAKEAEEEAE